MAWWKKETSEPTAQASEASKAGVWDSETSKAVADARKAQRSRVAGSKKNEQGNEGTQTGGNLPQASIEQIKKMFTPDAWRAIVKAPFALGQAITGRKCWELEKDKEDTLAVSTAMTAEYFATTDPKWLAVAICSFNWAVILTEKLAANARERAKEQELNPPQKEAHPQEPASSRTPLWTPGKVLNAGPVATVQP